MVLSYWILDHDSQPIFLSLSSIALILFVVLVTMFRKGSGVRFSELPRTSWDRKAILCAGYLPTEIQFVCFES